MKLVIPAFALIAISAVYANGTEFFMKLPYKAALDVNVFGEPEKISEEPLKISQECSDQFLSYLDCLDDGSESNETYCKTFSTDRCEKFFNDPKSVLSNCKDSPDYMKIINEINEELIVTKFTCQKDESGKECPFSKIASQSFTYINGKDYQTMKDDTCNSKICKEATYNTVCKSDQTLLTFSDKSGLCAYLEKCSNNAFSNNGSDSSYKINSNSFSKDDSDSSSLKIGSGSGFLITLGLLLLSLY